MLISRAPMLSVSLGQGTFVSRPFLTFGTVSGSLAFPAALMFSGSLAGGALAQMLSISLYCCDPIKLQACLSPSYTWTLELRLGRTQL